MSHNETWVERFMDELTFRGARPRTKAAYQARLGVFLEYIGDTPLEEVKRAQCMDFLNDLGLSASSTHAYITTLKSMGRFLEADLFDQGWRNVFNTLRYPKLEAYEPLILTVQQVKAMIDWMPKRSPTQKRERAMVMTLYSTGLRCTELADLKLEDVDVEAREVYVADGKGGKSRWTVIDKHTAEAIEAWLAVRHRFQNADSPYLFIGRGTPHMSRRSVYNVVSAAAERIDEDASPHTLRRSRATHLREANVPLDVIQKMLGHSSSGVTSTHYVKFGPEFIQSALEAAL